MSVGFCDTDALYDRMTRTYCFDALSGDDYFIDYQNLYTHLGVMSVRGLFCNAADVFIREGELLKAEQMLDRGCQTMKNYPLETIPLGFSGNDYVVISMVDAYYRIGCKDKARELGTDLGVQLLETSRFYLGLYDYAQQDFELAANYIFYLNDVFEKYGDKQLADKLDESFSALVKVATGQQENES